MNDNILKCLEGSAAFINDAAPKLEKLSEFEDSKESFNKNLAQKLAAAGFIASEDVNSVKDELDGGFDKVSDAVDFIISKYYEIRDKNEEMGKQASESFDSDENLSADDVFDKCLGLK